MSQYETLAVPAPTILVHAKDVEIGDRIRQKHDPQKMKELIRDLRENGQINAISINGMELDTGFRRTVAVLFMAEEGQAIGDQLPEGDPRRYPVGYVRAYQLRDLDEITRLKLELQENRARENFSEAEEALGLRKLKELLEKKSGRRVDNRKLAKEANTSVGQATMGLRVAKAVVEDGRKELLEKKSIFSAYQQLQTIELQEKRKAQVEKQVERGVAEDHLTHGDAREWIKTFADESVDFINFDPPWGIDVDGYDRAGAYETFDDSISAARRLTEPLIPELYRILKPDSWMVVWFGIQFYEELRIKLETLCGEVDPKKDKKFLHRFAVDPVPSIWVKPNKSGAQNDSERFLLNVFEPFFVVRKGNPRLFKKAQSNVLTYNMPPKSDRFHFAQKPVDLCTDVLERYTFGDMLCVDPTFGSGAFLKACSKLGRGYKGAETNEVNHREAVLWINRPD